MQTACSNKANVIWTTLLSNLNHRSGLIFSFVPVYWPSPWCWTSPELDKDENIDKISRKNRFFIEKIFPHVRSAAYLPGFVRNGFFKTVGPVQIDRIDSVRCDYIPLRQTAVRAVMLYRAVTGSAWTFAGQATTISATANVRITNLTLTNLRRPRKSKMICHFNICTYYFVRYFQASRTKTIVKPKGTH